MLQVFVLSLDHVAGCRQPLLELFHSVSAVDLEEEGGEDDEDTETRDGREAVLVDDAGQEDGQSLRYHRYHYNHHCYH